MWLQEEDARVSRRIEVHEWFEPVISGINVLLEYLWQTVECVGNTDLSDQGLQMVEVMYSHCDSP